jgi:hypothetical protein
VLRGKRVLLIIDNAHDGERPFFSLRPARRTLLWSEPEPPSRR